MERIAQKTMVPAGQKVKFTARKTIVPKKFTTTTTMETPRKARKTIAGLPRTYPFPPTGPPSSYVETDYSRRSSPPFGKRFVAVYNRSPSSSPEPFSSSSSSCSTCCSCCRSPSPDFPEVCPRLSRPMALDALSTLWEPG